MKHNLLQALVAAISATPLLVASVAYPQDGTPGAQASPTPPAPTTTTSVVTPVQSTIEPMEVVVSPFSETAQQVNAPASGASDESDRLRARPIVGSAMAVALVFLGVTGFLFLRRGRKNM